MNTFFHKDGSLTVVARPTNGGNFLIWQLLSEQVKKREVYDALLDQIERMLMKGLVVQTGGSKQVGMKEFVSQEALQHEPAGKMILGRLKTHTDLRTRPWAFENGCANEHFIYAVFVSTDASSRGPDRVAIMAAMSRRGKWELSHSISRSRPMLRLVK
ncbi:hypothetical protein IQ22_02838 [Pseudomonas duriflava]|uniref:Uncharacterized protein n=1 Tax=Pseudomonas duriflava TaxID=459528 RepID=A0A562Q8D4_9PSED|nr:hypothetical protein [Pseudomonas duriflava]TWI53002.1 hypothetical protein IQ22_02838 [Pseudomonas duriflava]